MADVATAMLLRARIALDRGADEEAAVILGRALELPAVPVRYGFGSWPVWRFAMKVATSGPVFAPSMKPWRSREIVRRTARWRFWVGASCA